MKNKKDFEIKNLYLILKNIILDTTKKINKKEPKNFEIALDLFSKELSDIKGLKICKLKNNEDTIEISFHDEPIAHVGGMFLTLLECYSFFNDESEIFFFEDAELHDIQVKYLSLLANIEKETFNKLSLKEQIITLEDMLS